ncbi:hypothetical protein HDK64DRAFT_257523 [Phyllosticta capitalensis]
MAFDCLSQSKWLWFRQPQELLDLELFDQASRGTWGSTCLLFDCLARFRKSYLTIFGALLTIVALAIGPLSQGIVKYYSCAILSTDAVAHIPRISKYTAVGGYMGTGTFQLDAPMTAAVYTGLLDPPISSTVPITCPTGNCTFPGGDDGPTFSTLAMCYSCRDITTTIIWEQSPKSEFIGNWTLRLPSGLHIVGLFTSNPGSETVFNSTTSTAEDTETIAFEALMLNEDENCKSQKVTKNDEPCSYHGHSRQNPFAIRCSLEPCVKTFRANVTRAEYRETCLKTEKLEKYWLDTVLVNKTTLRNGVWEDCPTSNHATHVNTFQYNKSTTGDYTSDNYTHEEPVWYPADCAWNFGFDPNKTISEFLAPKWTGDMTYSSFGSEPRGEYWLKDLWRNGKANMRAVNASMEGLALAITSQMRRNPDAADIPSVNGTVLDSVTCVRVRWIWLLYPISALCLTVVFLSMAIFQGRASHQLWHNDWKSSSLALLFHGLEAETRNAYGAVPKQEDMVKAAEQIRVQLVEGENGWRFSETKQPADEEDAMAAGVPGEARSDNTSLAALGHFNRVAPCSIGFIRQCDFDAPISKPPALSTTFDYDMIRPPSQFGKPHRRGLIWLVDAPQEVWFRHVSDDLDITSTGHETTIAIAFFLLLHGPLRGFFFHSGGVGRANLDLPVASTSVDLILFLRFSVYYVLTPLLDPFMSALHHISLQSYGTRRPRENTKSKPTFIRFMSRGVPGPLEIFVLAKRFFWSPK